MHNPQLNLKLVGSLLSLAFVSLVLYIAALLYSIPKAHAQEIIFGNVAIEDGSLKPLALGSEINATVNSGRANALLKVETSGNATSSQHRAASSTDNAVTKLNAMVTSATSTTDAATDATATTTTSYEEPARLFGFIPIFIKVRTEVDANGHVVQHYPWYSFLLVR
jgi:hypothetical protein